MTKKNDTTKKPIAKIRANQHEYDPRQIEFKRLYTDIESETFSNKYQSLVKAGYTKKTAERLTATSTMWLREIFREINESRLIEKSQKVIEKRLDESELDLDHKKLGLDAAKHMTKLNKGANINVTNNTLNLNNSTNVSYGDDKKELFDSWGKEVLEIEGSIIDIE